MCIHRDGGFCFRFSGIRCSHHGFHSKMQLKRIRMLYVYSMMVWLFIYFFIYGTWVSLSLASPLRELNASFSLQKMGVQLVLHLHYVPCQDYLRLESLLLVDTNSTPWNISTTVSIALLHRIRILFPYTINFVTYTLNDIEPKPYGIS